MIMQPAAFLCVICAICGRITRKSTLSIAKEETPMSLADLADLRRQKTVRSNVSAKADAADNAEKDSYHIVECCSCLYNKSVREHACSFLVLSLPFPYSFLVLSFLALSLLFTYVIQTAVLTESKCRNKRNSLELVA